tara:strand:- start:1091 stop:1312 length:222 start_codon:yes stop_codon:yes gene_type:complete
MSDLAKEVDYVHVKIKLSVIVIIEILIDNLIHIALSVVDEIGNIGLGYCIEVALCEVKGFERFILHGVSARQG